MDQQRQPFHLIDYLAYYDEIFLCSQSLFVPSQLNSYLTSASPSENRLGYQAHLGRVDDISTFRCQYASGQLHRGRIRACRCGSMPQGLTDPL